MEERSLALRSVGWLLLAFDGLLAVFIFVGIRTGSLLWLLWTGVDGALGLGLVMAGGYLEQKASLARGHRVEPHLHAGAEAEHREAA